MMTRKTYREVADVIARARREYPEESDVLFEVTRGLETVFRADNPRFDRERFRAACGE